MAIVLPTNADTDRYDYQTGTGTTLTFAMPEGFTKGALLGGHRLNVVVVATESSNTLGQR